MPAFFPVAIVAPAYTPGVKPSPPRTTLEFMDEIGRLTMPAIEGSTTPKVLPLKYRQYKKSSIGPQPKTRFTRRTRKPGMSDALKKRIDEAKFRNKIRAATKARVGGTARNMSGPAIVAIAAALAASIAQELTNAPVAQDKVEAERNRRKQESLSCVNVFQTLHRGFVDRWNHQDEIFKIGIISDDNAKRYRDNRGSRRNP